MPRLGRCEGGQSTVPKASESSRYCVGISECYMIASYLYSSIEKYLTCLLTAVDYHRSSICSKNTANTCGILRIESPLTMVEIKYENTPVKSLPYFMPEHMASPGMAQNLSDSTPTIFRPLKIRGITLRNRICVSPMCHYSCAPLGPNTGALTPLYFTTIGHYAFKGAALTMLEATGVCPSGRISVNCPGLWNTTQQNALKGLADFVHAQGALIGVQLSHAGRKGSTQAPWVALRQGKSSARAETVHGGWPDDVVGPSGGQALSWDGKRDDDADGGYWAPREMTCAEIGAMIADFASAARRAVEAGVDAVEVHASHGYLFHQFISPLTNYRTDEYGGSFDNRIRVIVETIEAVRAVIPDAMPLFVRISATDWMEESELGAVRGTWDMASTLRFAKLLPALGVDVLDVSSAGNHHAAAHTVFNAGKAQAEMAATIRRAIREADLNLLVGTVGEISSGAQARRVLQDDLGHAQADLISIGRQFLREPGWVMRVAEELGVDAAWPTQIARPQIVKTPAKI